MQSDDYWRNRKNSSDSKLGVARRSPTPLYVNLTQEMIVQQSSKRKRPMESDLYCHNCKTKDTPEWRRGPLGAKTLCNACGIRWRLSQAEAAKQKKGDPDSSPPSSLGLQFLLPQQQSPTQQSQQSQQSQQNTSSQSPVVPQQSMLQQQQMRHLHMLQQQQFQYNHSHHHHQHPQQQHMILPGHVGLAQENTSGRASSNSVISPLIAPSPIAT